MKRHYTNSFILNALNLPNIRDLETFSNSIGISQRLIHLLANYTPAYYRNFSIPKKNGTKREINTPTYSLKLVQRWILKEILEKIDVSEEAMAFKKGLGNGIRKNAEIHKYSVYLLQLDIKDFFTSIKKEKVFYLFRDLGYNIVVSNILANLCTYKGFLPQGGVCSPYISNLICYKLDKRLKGLCAKRDILYTRYADDLTFSCDNKETLKKVRNIIEDIIKNEGFEINYLKTRFLSPSSHKKITGITVNDNRIRASKKLKRTVRSMIHHAFVSADYSSKDRIRGYVSFIDSIEEGYKDKVCKYIDKLANDKNYRYFEDIVVAYNNNKIFKELADMTFEELSFNDPDDPDDPEELIIYFISECVEERYSFLKNRGIKIDFFPDDYGDEVAAENQDGIAPEDTF
ncbi:retron St85 family RNA-directed DNA polymerase [Bacillus sp. (in: firmicutes)]|uniref:retron St85 family RNA-directed DNA polymerase n=1 Tax=Bacillus sp. TaxID=1409 RepID=UPI0028FDC64F|nr:retron St85 family RNA-directed DNA polymerase [Bacillus sp. (in: firmicutes)]MDU2391255.1 retron St85 family RNA-directed DNA polymerase [Bacillus sp. (in: firmicutes)]